jgi:hypothetical protein
MNSAGFQILHKLAFSGLRDEAQIRADVGILRDAAQNRNHGQAHEPPTERLLSFTRHNHTHHNMTGPFRFLGAVSRDGGARLPPRRRHLSSRSMILTVRLSVTVSSVLSVMFISQGLIDPYLPGLRIFAARLTASSLTFPVAFRIVPSVAFGEN